VERSRIHHLGILKPFKRTRAVLNPLCVRPEYYGFPEGVEFAAESLCHAWLRGWYDSWTCEATRSLWRAVAGDLGFGARFAADAQAHAIERKLAWGDDEELAWRQVVARFSDFFQALKPNLKFEDPAIPERIEDLLDDPKQAASPDNLDTALLLLLLAGAGSESLSEVRFYELYRQELESSVGRPSLGFYHVGPRLAWLGRQPKEVVRFESFPQVAAGIREVIRRIEQGNHDVPQGSPRRTPP
jgi:hypothetical protein